MKIIVYSLLLVSFAVYGCKDASVEPEATYESTERYSGSIKPPSGVKNVVLRNPIGYTFIYGSTDSVTNAYVLDRTAKAADKETASAEMKKIHLENIMSADTLFYDVRYPDNLHNYYLCNLSLDVYYKHPVIIKRPNQGVYARYLKSNLYIECEAWNATADKHNGSLDIKSVSGNILVNMKLPLNGFCNCYTESGNIDIIVSKNTSASLDIKTVSGTILYENLNLTIEKNTKTELKGKLGSSQGVIALYSKSGRISVRGTDL